MLQTRERWRFRLPHWEVAGRLHFVTIRCAGSMPDEALFRVREIAASLRQTTPASPSFAQLQRRYFAVCEKAQDAGWGFCPFRAEAVCTLAVESLAAFAGRHGWRVTDCTLMPNHVHFLLSPLENAESLRQAIRGWKWSVASSANRLLGRRGAFWQSDWFDRWMRDESEVVRVREYIRLNPVKAGLAKNPESYPWTRSWDPARSG